MDYSTTLLNLEGIFVGDLGVTVDESQLIQLFSPYGTITQVEIKRDKKTRHSLGYGFIYFETRQQQEKVLSIKDNFV